MLVERQILKSLSRLLSNKNNLFAIILLFGLVWPTLAQDDCEIYLSGKVLDRSSGRSLSFASVRLLPTGRSIDTDDSGNFGFDLLCRGEYDITVTFIGYSTQNETLQIAQDSSITIYLAPKNEMLREAHVAGDLGQGAGTQSNVPEEEIRFRANQSVSGVVAQIPGVSIIGNGNGMSQAVVHGLTGSRLPLVVNNQPLASQQWGADHGPEIDPLIQSDIKVIKGVETIEYPVNAIGGLIVANSESLVGEEASNGKLSYFFDTNGMGHTLHGSVVKRYRLGAWSVHGTGKYSGDKHAPDYYLNNTGAREANVTAQGEFAVSDRWKIDANVSTFNAVIGVLRGAHIGNLTDLESALSREEPFFTEAKFSYNIEAPSQQVNHVSATVGTKALLAPGRKLELRAGWQSNDRQEFDVRRGDRSDIPALSLEKKQSFFETIFEQRSKSKSILKSGLQVHRSDNFNDPETGILPLIPDYIEYEAAAFVYMQRFFKRTNVGVGARYTVEDRRVAAISTTVPRVVERYTTTYHNVSAMIDVDHRLNENWTIGGQTGLASRGPEVNELYSNGLHQGVSGFEEGDPELQQETSLKTSLIVSHKISERVRWEALAFAQYFADYIFLEPQNDFVLTIRGAFPLFRYEQTDALLIGADLSVVFDVTDQLWVRAVGSYLQGSDLSNNSPLVFMPPSNARAEINYDLEQVGPFNKVSIQANCQWVDRQNHLEVWQDFSSPPVSYTLLGGRVQADLEREKSNWNLFVSVDNVLNVSYRNYLNRLRYFADEPGISIFSGITFSF